MNRIDQTVIHYGSNDPDTTTGGVETFARNLRGVFEQVVMMTPSNRDENLVRMNRLPVICDNHLVADWPEDIPVIGFQHGVAAVKFRATHSVGHWLLRRRQRAAAGRKRTLWVACAQWISDVFGERYGNHASHIVYHPIDVERFDGQLKGQSSNLILHDARTRHKGRDILPSIVDHFGDWTFEHLNCAPAQVPARMREARAFIHLSRYEGNSIVCNEAMAMDLPCLFTRVGLFLDAEGPTDVFLVDPDRAFRDVHYLIDSVGSFLESLSIQDYHPRSWTAAHATFDCAVATWKLILRDLDDMW